MTDLKTFINMLNNSEETFSKETSVNGYTVKILERNIVFYFNKDESFHFCTTIKFDK